MSPDLAPPTGTSGPALRAAARQYVGDGEALATFLDDLEFAHQALDLPPPSIDVVKAASLAWADEILGKLEGIACEDPLTGMSSAAHARVHLKALYRASDARAGADVLSAYRLVVVSMFESDPDPSRSHPLEAAFDQSLRLATVAEAVRLTFRRCDVVAPLQPGRVLAVVGREDGPDDRADELACLLRRRLPISCAPRVLVEPMPASEEGALALLETLA